MGLHLKVRNFRGLRSVDWSPSGVCALVGPNGSGKTTLLDVMALLRDSLDRGLARAFEAHGGMGDTRNVYAAEGEPFDFEVSDGSVAWQLAPVQTPIGFRPAERVTESGALLVQREAGSDTAQILGDDVPARDVLAFHILTEWKLRTSIPPSQTDVAGSLARLLQRYRLYENYDLRTLRRSGSTDSADRRLAGDGNNVFSVLRNWRDKRDDRHRADFVIEGLREMFGDFFEDLDFGKAGQVVGADLHLRGGKKIPANLAPDGWYAALLHLTALASTDKGDVIAIDEPENALHPHAIKLLLELMRDWSQRHSTTILLATHSPVIIDSFKTRPEQLYVMEPSAPTQPVALSELKEPEWLAHFSLGALYAREEFGAPSDGDADRPDHDR